MQLQYQCIYCHWTINVPLRREKFRSLVEFLSKFLRQRFGISGIKGKVLKNIKNVKEIQGIESDEDYPICRYCLVEIFQLYVDNEKALKELNNFLRTYDFKGSIIC